MSRNFEKVNLNNYIKFRPNKDQLAELRRWEFPDDDGYYSAQIWDFMARFGKHMNCGMHCPINTNVFIEVDK